MHAIGVDPYETYMRAGAYAISSRNSPQRQAEHRDVLGHDLARVDLDAAAIADDDDAAAGRDDRQIVIEIDVGEHFENHVRAAAAGDRGDLVEVAGVLVVDGVRAPCARTSARPSSVPAVPITVAPTATANCVAAMPTPPLAPWIEHACRPRARWRGRTARATP